MELDLNQEPLDPTHASSDGFDSLLEELETAHEHVQDRIRRLEVITSRVRQRQRWPPVHSPIQITNFTGQAGAEAPAEARDEGMERQGVEERVVESGKGYKRKGAHLIAKALGVETDASKEGGSTGNLFDCNICLEMARDPVLTCCGHLFCWPCFCQLAYVYSNAKECPVCKGEVTETGIIPIYGNASAGGNCELGLKGAGLRVPPRPIAPRIESFRQQLISQGASSSVIQSIRRFNYLIGGLGARVQSQSPSAATDRNNGLLTQSRPQTGNDRGTDSSPISSLLVRGAASFSSLSSALNSAMDSAERLVEDLESYIHDHQARDDVNRSSTLNGNIAATDSTAAASTSPFSRNVDTTADIGSEIQTTDSNLQTETNPLDPSSSHSGSTRVSTSRRVSNDRRRRRSR
ncbi:E3 ubiquitin-protein ligase RMA2 [Spatholobus suberectus]|nr:E3 ubiquitin-protein ligase RMA2 [Spatholobus suberectus]